MRRAASLSRPMALAAMALAPAACGESGTTPASSEQVTDSAGVRIVTSDPGDAVYAALATEPVLSVGLLEGPPELLFGRIVSVALDGPGNLVVADRQASEIRIFDARGAHLRTLGGEGGPRRVRAAGRGVAGHRRRNRRRRRHPRPHHALRFDRRDGGNGQVRRHADR